MQKKDTIYLHADTLFNQNDSLGKPFFTVGYFNVKLYNTSMQAICDSMYFDRVKNVLELHKKPIVWSQNAELKGEKMQIHLNDSLLEKILITENASAIMEIDSGKYYNQLAGKEITAFFKDNALIRSDVNGNARTIFFPEDEEKTDTTIVIKRLGMNRLYASDLRVYLDSGEVRGVTYFDKPDGVFYPMDQLNKEEQFISNFMWQAFLRPKNWMEIIH